MIIEYISVVILLVVVCSCDISSRNSFKGAVFVMEKQG